MSATQILNQPVALVLFYLINDRGDRGHGLGRADRDGADVPLQPNHYLLVDRSALAIASRPKDPTVTVPPDLLTEFVARYPANRPRHGSGQ
jgi:hypothetical protein